MRRIAVALRLGPLAAALACAAPRPAAPPLAEFVISAGDSSYWARIGSGERELQRVPMVVTRFGDRFQELYTSDDDYSYDDAVFVGQSVWRRDIESGDSLRLLTDSEPARLADAWGDMHPRSRPLGDDDPEPDDPAITVTTTIDFLDAAGPFVGIARHLDLSRGENDGVRTTRSAVLDLRRPGRVRLAELVGGPTARRMLADAESTLRSAADSTRFASAEDRRTALLLAHTRLDDAALSLQPSAGALEVQLLAAPPGLSEVAVPRAVARVARTRELAFDSSAVPSATPDGALHWQRGTITIDAVPDSGGATARLLLRDGRHSWALGALPMPVRRLYWMDHVSDAQRRALERAFGEASLYDENVRTASAVAPVRPPHLRTPRA